MWNVFRHLCTWFGEFVMNKQIDPGKPQKVILEVDVGVNIDRGRFMEILFKGLSE